jgi:DNA (cytosine-5)-methyltransferase 1
VLKYFSTFTGIGGLDVGLEELGAECICYSEIKESSVRIYDRHFPGRRNFGDITAIVPEELPDFDLMTGGFPCQSFSLAGQRKGFKDRGKGQRGVMIFHLADILEAKKPAFAVLENVRGIVSHDRGRTVKNVVNLLASAGYFVRIVLLNACHYGSAQNRERVFFLCCRENDFRIKNPEKMDDSKRFRDFRRDPEAPVWVDEADWMLRNTLKRETGQWPPEANAVGFSFELVGGYDRVGTIMTSPGGGGPSRNHAKVAQQDGVFRYLDILEAERLQGFPDNWTAFETDKDRWFAVGNAVNCHVSRYLFKNYLRGVWW